MAPSPTRTVILDAIDMVRRHELPLTPKNVRANIKTGALTMDDAGAALRKHIHAQIPIVMREEGLIIADTVTRERKDFWASSPDDLEEQMQLKEESSKFDRDRLAVDRAILDFLREQEKVFGYEVYPGLFHTDIARIYAMHGMQPPAGGDSA